MLEVAGSSAPWKEVPPGQVVTSPPNSGSQVNSRVSIQYVSPQSLTIALITLEAHCVKYKD